MSGLLDKVERMRSEYGASLIALIEEVMAQETGASSTLDTMNRYHLSTGGKRLRALLPLVVAQALGHDPGAIVPFGAACEMLHNATLVHDDLQDGDTIRRGEETVWVKYGSAQAINLGDAMLYVTVRLIDHLDALPIASRYLAVQRIARETLRVVDGQEREFALQTLDRPSREAYFAMVEGKTSGLFALPIVGAAELCGADAALLSSLQEATRHLGVVFQIQDDILDLFGDKGRDEVGSDIGEGKISMLVVEALARASEDDARWLRDLLRTPREEVRREDVDRARDLFVESGALEAAFDEISDRAARATRDDLLSEHPRLAEIVEGMSSLFLQPIDSISTRMNS